MFKPFFEVFPAKFQNKTNGVTPRRWLAFCNPPLRELITETLGSDAWINDLYALTALRDRADDPDFQRRWREVKEGNKAAAIGEAGQWGRSAVAAKLPCAAEGGGDG